MDASITQPLGTPAQRQAPTNTRALAWPYGGTAFAVPEPPPSQPVSAAPGAPPVPALAPATPREPFSPLHGFGCSCGVCQHERFTGEPLYPRETLPPIRPAHDWVKVNDGLYYDRTTSTYTRV